MEKINKIKDYTGPILRLIIIALTINSLLEMLNGRSFIDLQRFAAEKTMYFWLNTLIIMLTISISGIFKKRYMLEFVVIFLWLAIGVTNFIMLNFFRTSPMTAMDLKVIKNAVLLLPNYFTDLQIAWIIIALFGVGFLFFKVIKHLSLRHIPVSQRKRSVINFIMVSAFLGILSIIPLYSEETSEPEESTDIVENYENYGFTYCFTGSLIGQGIEKPEEYSREIIEETLDGLEEKKQVDIKPNIIMVQLESVFNVERLIQNKTKDQPMKTYMQLMETYPSGLLTVPVLGDGTANTEFEVLTGMNLDFFGLGEYPYNGILKEVYTESLAYNLKNHGYATFAMHNNTGEFYNRHIVYEHLGFDAFLSLEAMQDVEMNALGWAKDEIYLDEIMKRLQSTSARDFIFAVSVQPHGKYPQEDPYGYYMEQLEEVDTFIKALIDLLENHTEPTILVLYGDHLPPLELTKDDLENANLYATEYVIWNNFGMQNKGKNLMTYELAAEVLNQAKITDGIGAIASTHLQSMSEKERNEQLHLLQYDMLYGQGYIFERMKAYTNENYRWIGEEEK